jgi:3-hydroxymyristoyl/3-hydroxydecanoyl-(acyl carrier protein) dehydratase
MRQHLDHLKTGQRVSKFTALSHRFWPNHRRLRRGFTLTELMIEGAAQIGTFLIKKTAGWSVDSFVGLTGVNDARIRGQVVPPARVYFVTGNIKVSGRRMARMPAQVFCNGQLVMELELLGVML